ncbi:MAG: T9SS type A sorting domain-containing protein [Coprobacter sp.]|nr:T9SS type A sorting domain-containing protein [Coprobacter sp.]
MKQITTLMAGFIALMLPAMSFADNLVIKTIPDNGVTIIPSGEGDVTAFEKLTGNIGNTNTDVVIDLGEVDFGENGENYKATGIYFANGWYVDGWAILHAGADYESSVPFTQMQYNETGGYQTYNMYAAQMGYNRPDTIYKDIMNRFPEKLTMPITYVKPTGKQRVYLTFIGDGAGNILNVTFYENEIDSTMFLTAEEDLYNAGIMLRSPDQVEGYENSIIKCMTENSVAAVPVGEGTDFPETRIDSGNYYIDQYKYHWGWTTNGFIADYGEVDFGETGEYTQLVARVQHWSANPYDHLDFYIDEVKDENLIAHLWTGFELRDSYKTRVINIAPITGKHKVFVKWIEGSTDLRSFEFVKGQPWNETGSCGIVFEDIKPNDDAFHFTYIDCPEGQGNPWFYEVKNRGQYESAGNIGYTGNGTVISFFDATGNGIDFGNGEYKRIIVNHSCDKSWTDEIENSNFSFYLDLDPNYIYTAEDWSGNLAGIIEGHEPIAVVRLQGSGSWGKRYATAGEITTTVTGQHELFMVYNTPTTDAGANVFDIWLDGGSATTAIKSINLAGVSVYTNDGEIVIDGAQDAQVTIYTLNGQVAAQAVATDNSCRYNVEQGFYIVKVTREGMHSTFKVVVK